MLLRQYCFKIILECSIHFVFIVIDPLIFIAWSVVNCSVNIEIRPDVCLSVFYIKAIEFVK